MTKIYNRNTLDQEIDRLKNLATVKENNLQAAFQELSNNLTPANLISSGFKSIFNRSPLSKPLISTGIGLLSGLFIEKVILKNANILVKYGIAQVAMTIISQFVDENWNPNLIAKLKASIAQVIEKNNGALDVDAVSTPIDAN